MAKKRKEKVDNRSENPKLDSLVGKSFQWCEPWEEETEHNGETVDELCGEWTVTSVCADGETVWLQFESGDHMMEFPISLLPENLRGEN